MDSIIDNFLNIKYEGERFSGGRLPLDILADLQALEDILTSFAREIWLEQNSRERMPNGYTDWFQVSLVGIEDGCALPKLRLSVSGQDDTLPIPDFSRVELMERAEEKFAEVLQAAQDGHAATLSPTQIRNFNRFLTNLKPGEYFKYTKKTTDGILEGGEVISLDVERRKRFLTSVTTSYEQRVQGRARLKSVDENGNLKLVSAELKEFSIVDNSRDPTIYGNKLGSYYEFDLTVERRHDDSVQSVVTIHELSLLEDPAITAIDRMASLQDGWLDGHGVAISEGTREAAKKFLLSTNRLPAFYAVAPTEEGNILLEYDCGGWDYGIEINADGSYDVFGIDMEDTADFSTTFQAGDYRLFIAAVKETLGQ